jgi:preprotein translocase subunit SecD
MNRYPLWKYLVIVVALVIGALYTLPNFFGEAPAVQISAGKVTVKIDSNMQERIAEILKNAQIEPKGIQFERIGANGTFKIRLDTTDTQLKAKDVLQKSLNPDSDDQSYVVALNLISNTPAWLSSIGAMPMYLGLDLRGGVHFLLQVDMSGALQKKLESLSTDTRSQLREKGLRHSGIERQGDAIVIRFPNQEDATGARTLLNNNLQSLDFNVEKAADGFKLVGKFRDSAIKEVQENAVKQNITTLHNRVNELGVAEPVIQQQGQDRIIVQLPGVQDTARAKDIIGRTATLESRLADPVKTYLLSGELPPPGSDVFKMGDGRQVVFKKSVIFSGDRITSASAGFDSN